jgi:hypothetical protein
MNYTALPRHSNQRRELHVWRQQIGRQQLHSATLQVTQKTQCFRGDGVQRRYASDVAFCIIRFPLTVDNSDMN